MSNESTIPAGVKDRGVGVLVERGGYQQIGNTTELPTVSGPNEMQRQDGLSKKDLTLTIIDTTIEDGHEVEIGRSSYNSRPKRSGGGWETTKIIDPEADDVLPTGEPVSHTPKPQSKSASVKKPAKGPTKKTTVAPEIEQEDEQPVEAVTTLPQISPALEKIKVAMEHESGFKFSYNWDLVIMSSGDVSTLVLATNDSGFDCDLPEGNYSMTIFSEEGEDKLSVYNGRLGFSYGLRFYIFVVL